jgi:hypothetical protein
LFWCWNIDFSLAIETGNKKSITSLNFLFTLPDELELMDFLSFGWKYQAMFPDLEEQS